MIRADVYCDLRKRCTSFRALDGAEKGRVVAKPSYAIVRDVTFRVQLGTLNTIRTKRVRAVCAYARGAAAEASAADLNAIATNPAARRVHFNPFRADTFTLDDGTAVTSAAV